MLVNVLMRLALGMAVLLTGSVMLIRVQPGEDSALKDFLASTPDCPTLCALGILPGRTTVGEALENLQSHAWVANPRLNASGAGYGEIRWTWSGSQPDLIDDSHPGRVTFYWDSREDHDMLVTQVRIETVTVYTHIRTYLLQRWFGTPDNGGAAFRLDKNLGYTSTYNIPYGVIDVTTIMPCPASLLSFWDARSKITLSIGHSTGEFVAPRDMVKMC